jgi:hypothetical protein
MLYIRVGECHENTIGRTPIKPLYFYRSNEWINIIFLVTKNNFRIVLLSRNFFFVFVFRIFQNFFIDFVD